MPAVRSRPAPRWVPGAVPSSDLVAQLHAELQLPSVVCELLVRRGYSESEAARRYLRPRLEHLASPSTLKDCNRVVDRLVSAIQRQEVIFVHGDYDVDGMSSTALLTRVLRGLGAQRVVPWVPNRLTDGYDLGPAGVAAARAAGATVVVTCDCGTSAVEAVEELSRAGIDVIITDHHLPSQALPPAYAVVNPRRHDCESLDKDLAAVGVVYKIALALCDAMGVSPGLAHQQLDLVALATIADVAPLRGENRVLVRYGLKVLAETTHPGLRALVRAAAMEGKALTAGRVGFVLAPRLNAAGRIGDAKLGLSLLLAEHESDANVIARQLEEMNRDRQTLDQAVLSDAMRQVDAYDLDETFGLVLANKGWHAGVIGIVASRIVEQTCRPAVLIAVDDGVGKGSGRSIPAFDLHAALGACSAHFSRYGGHRAAAGLTMPAERIDAFREHFAAYAKKVLQADDLVPELRIDLQVQADHVGDELEKLLRHFEPFGVGNAAPTFALNAVRLSGAPRKIGKDGLRLGFSLPKRTLDGIAWGMPVDHVRLDTSIPVDVAFRLERDDYRGANTLQLRVHALRQSVDSHAE